jgi:hypothetical protein
VLSHFAGREARAKKRVRNSFRDNKQQQQQHGKHECVAALTRATKKRRPLPNATARRDATSTTHAIKAQPPPTFAIHRSLSQRQHTFCFSKQNNQTTNKHA